MTSTIGDKLVSVQRPKSGPGHMKVIREVTGNGMVVKMEVPGFNLDCIQTFKRID